MTPVAVTMNETITDINLFIEELRQYKEYYTTSLVKIGDNKKLAVDSIVTFNKVKIDECGAINLKGKNCTELWFNEKVRYIEKTDNPTYVRYLIYFENSIEPFYLTARK